MLKHVRWVAVVLLLFAFAYFIWPTPWSDEDGPGLVLKNRFTGEFIVWTDSGWEKVR